MTTPAGGGPGAWKAFEGLPSPLEAVDDLRSAAKWAPCRHPPHPHLCANRWTAYAALLLGVSWREWWWKDAEILMPRLPAGTGTATGQFRIAARAGRAPAGSPAGPVPVE